jgi:hypothetical protein
MRTSAVHDTLAVVIGTPKKGRPATEPFAHIIALDEGENVDIKTRICLHAIDLGDSGLDLADGVLAVKDGCALVGGGARDGMRSHFRWKELSHALQLPVKGFEGFTNTTPGTPHYLRLKNYDEDGVLHSNVQPGNEAWGVTALSILGSWNGWIDEGATWQERTQEFKTGPVWSKADPARQSAWVDTFRKFCERLGLDLKRPIEFDEPMSELTSRLQVALSIWRGACDQLT